jgi:hypothetical protein
MNIIEKLVFLASIVLMFVGLLGFCWSAAMSFAGVAIFVDNHALFIAVTSMTALTGLALLCLVALMS